MKKRRNPLIINLLRRFLAEREGFEPPVPLSTTVFKTVVIDHSTISPWSIRHKKYSCFVFDGAKVRIIYGLCKFSWYFFEIKSLFDERAISKEYDTMIYDVLLIIYWDFQT